MAQNYMNLNEFKTSGLLQEVNRQFFHPLGLALAVSTDADGKVIGIAGIIDQRTDPHGLVFNNLSEQHMLRANNVTGEQERRAAIREQSLGFNVQPLGENSQPPIAHQIEMG